MRARLTHTFDYRYSAPVFLGPHRFCLKPRGHGFQRLLHFHLAVTPGAVPLYPLVAASGDEILRARFEGSTEQLPGAGDQRCGDPAAPGPGQPAWRTRSRCCPTRWATSTAICWARWRAGCPMASTTPPRWTWPRRR
jgi:hypothetical protein